MSERSFHHGNLRAALLSRAEEVLRLRGVDALSLRELARDVGVSHGAPRNHFIDRSALLEALAERGFARLADDIRTALEGSDALSARLRSGMQAFVAFAARDSALLELMFAAKVDDSSPSVHAAAASLFQTISEIMRGGVAEGIFAESELEDVTLLVSAVAQGIASLVGSMRITAEQGERLTEDSVRRLLVPA